MCYPEGLKSIDIIGVVFHFPQINVEAWVRNAVKEKLQEPDVDIFDPAQNQVSSLTLCVCYMRGNAYRSVNHELGLLHSDHLHQILVTQVKIICFLSQVSMAFSLEDGQVTRKVQFYWPEFPKKILISEIPMTGSR